jgi:hypothetical protein
MKGIRTPVTWWQRRQGNEDKFVAGRNSNQGDRKTRSVSIWMPGGVSEGFTIITGRCAENTAQDSVGFNDHHRRPCREQFWWSL